MKKPQELIEEAATLRRVAAELEEEARKLSKRPSWAYDSIVSQTARLYEHGLFDYVAIMSREAYQNLNAQTSEYLNWEHNHTRGSRILASVATDYGDVRVLNIDAKPTYPLVYGRR